MFESIPRESTLFRRGWRFVSVEYDGWSEMKLTFLRWTFNTDKLLFEAAQQLNDVKEVLEDEDPEDRFFVRKMIGSIGRSFLVEKAEKKEGEETTQRKGIKDTNKYNSRPIGWNADDLGQPKNPHAMKLMSLLPAAEAALEEARRWHKSEKWYKDHGVPWKRGWLLHGDPGTGKTSFVRALGQDLDMPIFVFDLATMSDGDLILLWSEMLERTPCIALFEDVESVFEGRTNITADNYQASLTFTTFVNTLDGVENTDGIFIILTTNNISTIDPAIGIPSEGSDIASRPGRVDRAVKFDVLDEMGRKKMSERILSNFPIKKWEHVLNEGIKDTGAQFQERCCRCAMDLFWSKEKKPILVE